MTDEEILNELAQMNTRLATIVQYQIEIVKELRKLNGIR